MILSFAKSPLCYSEEPSHHFLSSNRSGNAEGSEDTFFQKPRKGVEEINSGQFFSYHDQDRNMKPRNSGLCVNNYITILYHRTHCYRTPV